MRNTGCIGTVTISRPIVTASPAAGPYRPARPGTQPSQRKRTPRNLSNSRCAAFTRMKEVH